MQSKKAFHYPKAFATALFLPLFFWAFLAGGCALFHTRPVQEMSDTVAALRAAKEVQADTYAPELFRQANEWLFRARNEYKFKNFDLAEEYSDKARKFAEDAEFEAIRNGGNRTDQNPSDPMDQSAAQPSPTPYSYPSPTGTPADQYDERKAKEDAANKPAAGPPSYVPVPVTVPTNNFGAPVAPGH